jgi:hypothetical protein
MVELLKLGIEISRANVALILPHRRHSAPRLSFTDQLRRVAANRDFNRKPYIVHRDDVGPVTVQDN